VNGLSGWRKLDRRRRPDALEDRIGVAGAKLEHIAERRVVQMPDDDCRPEGVADAANPHLGADRRDDLASHHRAHFHQPTRARIPLSDAIGEVKAPTGVEPVYQVLQTCA
jgi:hypothetical protein